jgi:hypothetical protein
MGGCLLACPVYDLLSVHWHTGINFLEPSGPVTGLIYLYWHTGILLWVGFLLILSQAFSHVCRYLQMGIFADCITLVSMGYHETTERNGMDLLLPHLS